MKRTFVYGKDVEAILKRTRVWDNRLQEMEQAIMAGDGDIIPGTGGFRKIRCGTSGGGKRGGLRIVFADYPQHGKTYFVAALVKGDKENFNARERNELRQVKQLLDKAVRS